MIPNNQLEEWQKICDKAETPPNSSMIMRQLIEEVRNLRWEYENECKFATNFENQNSALKAALRVTLDALDPLGNFSSPEVKRALEYLE